MNTSRVAPLWYRLLASMRTLGGRMFNLNDPKWGRGDGDAPSQGSSGGTDGSSGHKPDQAPQQPDREHPQRPNNQGPQGGPPDLDELWRDFNQKLGRLFGNKSGGRREPGMGGGFNRGSGGPTEPPNMKSAGLGLGVIGAIAVLIWLGTGFFIVQEGQQAVITQFGRFHAIANAGFNWRLPYPIQRHELVYVTQIRSVDVGRDSVIKATGLRDSAMLTEDENIVEIKFAVQYRLKDARAYLFETRDPQDTVVQAAETAVREVVGKMKMDSALSDERDQIGSRVRNIMQALLDRYKVGIEVVGINLQQGGVRPPEQVQAAFDDVLKAGQERERAKNEAQAYANEVIPRAVGSASRLTQEAEGYKSRIVAQAQGDAERFRSILVEYQRAPQVTRDRLYLEAMQQVYDNVTKVVVDSKQGSNLLYLPLDKIQQMVAQGAQQSAPAASTPTSTVTAPVASGGADSRGRDSQRSRDSR